jgi:superfamily II DNA or RNA helicase
MSAFATSGWDGRSSFFARRTCTFPAGFVHMVHGELKRAGYEVRIVKRPNPLPLGPENPIVDEFGNDDPRYDFQPRTLRQIEKHGRGIVQVATGGGKSKIAKLIAMRYGRPTLFLTTRGMLMYQMKDHLEDPRYRTGILAKRIGVLGDSEWAPSGGVNVGMVQTLAARLEEPTLEREI